MCLRSGKARVFGNQSTVEVLAQYGQQAVESRLWCDMGTVTKARWWRAALIVSRSSVATVTGWVGSDPFRLAAIWCASASSVPAAGDFGP